MGLINLQTNLKSLRFGNDRVHSGNSGQPYIQTPIPEGDTSVLPSQDFVLRGGLYAVRDTTEDILRLGKYFNDIRNPSGLLFTAKQNLLSRTAVRTQASTGLLNEGIYTPLSTLAQASVSAFGLHFNKQGLNPIPGTPGSLKTYSDSVNPDLGEAFSIKSIDKNRLAQLYSSKIIDELSYNPLTTGISPLPINILTYGGGPGSILGIGNTNIKFADQRTGINNPELKKSGFFPFNPKDPKNYSIFNVGKSSNSKLSINGNLLQGASNDYFVYADLKDPINNGFSFPEGQQENRYYGPQDNNKTLSFYPKNPLVNQNGSLTYNQDELINVPNSPTNDGTSFYIGRYNSTSKIGDFRKLLRNKTEENPSLYQEQIKEGIAPITPDYSTKNIEQRVKLGDPGNMSDKKLASYTIGSGGKYFGAASENSYDKINYKSLYSTDGLKNTATFDGDKNDLVKFSISVLDTRQNKNVYIHFRAFLNQISDGYSADWNSTQYIGRGEKFYTYAGFDRKVSLSWTVAAQSKVELIPMYKKLNYLASVCAPNYSEDGYMQGNIVQLTIGGYFYEQYGIITGFNYEMNDDTATWEIGIDDKGGFDSSVKELPHLIKVSGFNFIPIHTFVPRLQQNTFDKDGTLTKYGNERYIALANGKGENLNNYDS